MKDKQRVFIRGVKGRGSEWGRENEIRNKSKIKWI